ncbi:MAG: hypothetical protein ACJAZ2_001568 [Glaciecola sp.]
MLSADAKTELKQFAITFRKSRNRKDLIIVGHADLDGDYNYNTALSMRRAKAVRNQLELLGVKNRTQLISKGERHPAVSGNTIKDLALNRRVEIAIQASKGPRAKSLDRAKKQTFEINTNTQIQITGEKGTIIKFPKSCFKASKKDSLIQISLKEYTTQEDAILADLSTVTPSGKLIESKGMIHIEAKIGSRHIPLKRGKKIEIIFPKREAGDSTKIFYGQRFEQGVLWTAGQGPIGCNEEIIENFKGDKNQKGTLFRRTCTKADESAVIQESWHNDGTLTISQRRVSTADRVEAPLFSTRLGWINCDKFNQSKQPKIDFAVRVTPSKNQRVYLVFENINSLMPYSTRENNHYIFKNVPQDMKVKVVVLRPTKDDTHSLLAQSRTKISPRFTKKLHFKKVETATLELK